MSGIILSTDSVHLSDVAIINIHNGKTVWTNMNGFFQTDMDVADTLLIYHIAYQKMFITEKDNARKLYIDPEIQEIIQVDIIDKYQQELKNLQETERDIKRIAPLEKLSGFDLISREDYFIDKNGTHNKGFSPFFGPTVPVPVSKLTSGISKIKEHRELRKLTAHYHLKKNILPDNKEE